MYNFHFKWTVSKGRNTYGYNICSLYVNGIKVSSCNGGGYDMQGTALGNWVEKAFRDELLQLKTEFYGLTFHNPNFNPAKAKVKDSKGVERTVEELEKSGESLGLARYQAFYGASSKVPTENHIVPSIDGACGMSSVTMILNAIGYMLVWDKKSDRYKNHSYYTLVKK